MITYAQVSRKHNSKLVNFARLWGTNRLARMPSVGAIYDLAEPLFNTVTQDQHRNILIYLNQNAQLYCIAYANDLHWLTLSIIKPNIFYNGFTCARYGLHPPGGQHSLFYFGILFFRNHGVVKIHYSFRLPLFSKSSSIQQDSAVANGLYLSLIH